MDFHGMKRRQLQALCKKHKISANLTNLEMANHLTTLLMGKVERPVWQGRSCLKGVEEDRRESKHLVQKKVTFSPEDETFEFVKSNVKFTRVFKEVKGEGSALCLDNVENFIDSSRVTRSRAKELVESRPLQKRRGRKVVKNEDNSGVDEVIERGGRVNTRRSLREKGLAIEGKCKNVDVDNGDKSGKRKNFEQKDGKGEEENSKKKKELVEETVEPLKKFRRSMRNVKITEASEMLDEKTSVNESAGKEYIRRTRKSVELVQVESGSRIEADVEGRHEVASQREEIANVPLRKSRRQKSVTMELEKQRNDSVDVGERSEMIYQQEESSNVSLRRSTRGKSVASSDEIHGNDKVESEGRLKVVPQELPSTVLLRRSNRQKLVIPSIQKQGNDEVDSKGSGKVAHHHEGPGDVPMRRSTKGKSQNQSFGKQGNGDVDAVERPDIVEQVEPAHVPVRRSSKRKSLILSLEKKQNEKAETEKNNVFQPEGSPNVPLRRSNCGKSMTPVLEKVANDVRIGKLSSEKVGPHAETSREDRKDSKPTSTIMRPGHKTGLLDSVIMDRQTTENNEVLKQETEPLRRKDDKGIATKVVRGLKGNAVEHESPSTEEGNLTATGKEPRKRRRDQNFDENAVETKGDKVESFSKQSIGNVRRRQKPEPSVKPAVPNQPADLTVQHEEPVALNNSLTRASRPVYLDKCSSYGSYEESAGAPTAVSLPLSNAEEVMHNFADSGGNETLSNAEAVINSGNTDVENSSRSSLPENHYGDFAGTADVEKDEGVKMETFKEGSVTIPVDGQIDLRDSEVSINKSEVFKENVINLKEINIEEMPKGQSSTCNRDLTSSNMAEPQCKGSESSKRVEWDEAVSETNNQKFTDQPDSHYKRKAKTLDNPSSSKVTCPSYVTVNIVCEDDGIFVNKGPLLEPESTERFSLPHTNDINIQVDNENSSEKDVAGVVDEDGKESVSTVCIYDNKGISDEKKHEHILEDIIRFDSITGEDPLWSSSHSLASGENGGHAFHTDGDIGVIDSRSRDIVTSNIQDNTHEEDKPVVKDNVNKSKETNIESSTPNRDLTCNCLAEPQGKGSESSNTAVMTEALSGTNNQKVINQPDSLANMKGKTVDEPSSIKAACLKPVIIKFASENERISVYNEPLIDPESNEPPDITDSTIADFGVDSENGCGKDEVGVVDEDGKDEVKTDGVHDDKGISDEKQEDKLEHMYRFAPRIGDDVLSSSCHSTCAGEKSGHAFHRDLAATVIDSPGRNIFAFDVQGNTHEVDKLVVISETDNNLELLTEQLTGRKDSGKLQEQQQECRLSESIGANNIAHGDGVSDYCEKIIAALSDQNIAERQRDILDQYKEPNARGYPESLSDVLQDIKGSGPSYNTSGIPSTSPVSADVDTKVCQWALTEKDSSLRSLSFMHMSPPIASSVMGHQGNEMGSDGERGGRDSLELSHMAKGPGRAQNAGFEGTNPYSNLEKIMDDSDGQPVTDNIDHFSVGFTCENMKKEMHKTCVAEGILVPNPGEHSNIESEDSTLVTTTEGENLINLFATPQSVSEMTDEKNKFSGNCWNPGEALAGDNAISLGEDGGSWKSKDASNRDARVAMSPGVANDCLAPICGPWEEIDSFEQGELDSSKGIKERASSDFDSSSGDTIEAKTNLYGDSEKEGEAITLYKSTSLGEDGNCYQSNQSPEEFIQEDQFKLLFATPIKTMDKCKEGQTSSSERKMADAISSRIFFVSAHDEVKKQSEPLELMGEPKSDTENVVECSISMPCDCGNISGEAFDEAEVDGVINVSSCRNVFEVVCENPDVNEKQATVVSSVYKSGAYMVADHRDISKDVLSEYILAPCGDGIVLEETLSENNVSQPLSRDETKVCEPDGQKAEVTLEGGVEVDSKNEIQSGACVSVEKANRTNSSLIVSVELGEGKGGAVPLFNTLHEDEEFIKERDGKMANNSYAYDTVASGANAKGKISMSQVFEEQMINCQAAEEKVEYVGRDSLEFLGCTYEGETQSNECCSPYIARDAVSLAEYESVAVEVESHGSSGIELNLISVEDKENVQEAGSLCTDPLYQHNEDAELITERSKHVLKGSGMPGLQMEEKDADLNSSLFDALKACGIASPTEEDQESNQNFCINVNDANQLNHLDVLTNAAEMNDIIDGSIVESQGRIDAGKTDEPFGREQERCEDKKQKTEATPRRLTKRGLMLERFGGQQNSTVKLENSRTILIHATPLKVDRKEHLPISKEQRIGSLTTAKPEKRHALKDLSQK